MKRKPAFTRRAIPGTPVALAALAVAAACAAPMLATETPGGAAAPAPLICGVTAIERAGMVTFRPWLRSETGLSGAYSLTLAGAGTRVEQGGPFEAAAGARIDLATATLPGPARGYTLSMGVTAGGLHYTCRGDAAEI